MMPLPQLVAYPLLLVAIYAIYRVGRGRPRSDTFEWARLCTLAVLLGLIVALQVRFVAAGYVSTPFAMLGAILSIAGVFGLVGINLLETLDAKRPNARRGRPAAQSVDPWTQGAR